MVDTVRTLAALQALLPDNTSQDISPQDLRDFLVSVYGVTAVDNVATSETTASTTYTDLATTGPDVTVTVPASGIVVVHLSARTDNDTSSEFGLVSVALSGANTATAPALGSDNLGALGVRSVNEILATRTIGFTGLTEGSTTFTMKYKATGGTASFAGRQITVETKPGIT